MACPDARLEWPLSHVRSASLSIGTSSGKNGPIGDSAVSRLSCEARTPVASITPAVAMPAAAKVRRENMIPLVILSPCCMDDRIAAPSDLPSQKETAAPFGAAVPLHITGPA